jgi:hypothetical protein
MQSLRNNIQELSMDDASLSDQTMVEPTISPPIAGPLQIQTTARPQCLSSQPPLVNLKAPMQLLGHDAHTKAMMTRIATGQATAEEKALWEQHVAMLRSKPVPSNSSQESIANTTPSPPTNQTPCGCPSNAPPVGKPTLAQQKMILNSRAAAVQQQMQVPGLPLPDYQAKLGQLEQINKQRLLLARHEAAMIVKREFSNPPPQPSGQSAVPPTNNAPDCELQLRILEQQNDQRLAQARLEQGPLSIDRSDYKEQLRLMEQQNAQRLALAQQPPLPTDRQDYKDALRLLEQQNAQRVALAQQPPLPTNHPDYKEQLALRGQQLLAHREQERAAALLNLSHGITSPPQSAPAQPPSQPTAEEREKRCSQSWEKSCKIKEKMDLSGQKLRELAARSPPYSPFDDANGNGPCPVTLDVPQRMSLLERAEKRTQARPARVEESQDQNEPLKRDPWETDAERHARLFPKATRSNAQKYAKPFMDFLTNNPTVFHAVDAIKKDLRDNSFAELSERDSWSHIRPGESYFVERNGSSLIAFTVGKKYQPGNGAAILAGHVDALTAKLKPISQVPNKAGYLQLGVAPYAGAPNNTWWDRDLSIGGRVLVQVGDKIETKLVKLDWPIARIPTLAPHFGAAANGPFNPETQMVSDKI